MRRYRRHSNDDAAMGCIVYLLLVLFFMPLVGLYLVCGKDPEKKTLGWVLLIIGIILWIVVGVMSA